MNIELRQLSLENDLTEYNMLQDIDANENGFTNEVNGMSFERYKEWLIQQDNGNALFVNVLAKCKLLGYSKTKSFVMWIMGLQIKFLLIMGLYCWGY